MPQAFSYRRFSTPDQAKGDSERRQDARFQEVVERHRLTPATVYFDDGRSGWKKGQQRELEQFVELVKAGKIESGSWLVVENLDRFSRQGFWETTDLIRSLLKRGVILFIISPEMKLTPKSINDMSEIIRVAVESERAKAESDRKSELVKSAWGRKHIDAKQGTVGTTRGPAWLEWKKSTDGSRNRITKKVNERGEWHPLPERVKVVKQIFQWATVNGLGQRAIAKRLNAGGTPPFKTHRRNGNRWSWGYVRLILTDKRVIGELKSKQVGSIPNYYPAVIDEPTFLKSQALTSKRIRFRGKTTDKLANLFTGLAFDSESGSTMVYIKKGKDIGPRWIPSVYETIGKSAGKARSFPYDVFEEQFLALTSELTLGDIGRSDMTSDDEIDKLESKIAKLDIQVEKTQSAISSLEADPAIAVQALNDLGNQRKTLQAQLDGRKADKHATNPKEALKQSQTIVEQLRKAKGEALFDLRSRLRQAIRSLISRIDCQIWRRGWRTYILATITFVSGHTRQIIVATLRSKLLGVVADAEKWMGKPGGLTAIVRKDKVKNDTLVTVDEVIAVLTG